MAEITVSKASKSIDNRSILEEVSFLINKGDKIGMIGVNGAGKTTLMRMLYGELEADSGTISRRGDLRIGYLKQRPDLDSQDSLYEECKKGYARAFQLEAEMKELEGKMGEAADDPEELDRIMNRYLFLTDRFEEEGGLAYDSEIRGILKGMGFAESQFDQPASSLSGGEKARLELARLLCGRPDMLFLDEPTNHLDMEAVAFLEDFLQAFTGSVLLITHDRYFLNKVCSRIFLIQFHHIHVYDCGYEEYTRRRAKDLETQRHAYASQQAEIARQEEIIDRLSRQGGSLRKRGISQSRSRQKLLDKMERIEPPEGENQHMRLTFSPRYPSGLEVLDVKDLAKSFEGHPVFQGVTFHIQRGEKIGLIGSNGVGKTTLFRILLGQEAADGGRVLPGTAVKPAYYDQEQADLHLDKAAIDEIWDRHPRFTQYEVRSALAKFQFLEDDIAKPVAALSGGEKSRLSLLELMLSDANFLLLDEPTNHLDVESREILEEALQGYEGTVFAISHDRYFLNQVCDRIFVLTPKGMKTYLGNYDAYLGELEKAKGDPAGPPSHDDRTKTQVKKKQKEAGRSREANRALQKRCQELEQEVNQLEAQLVQLKREAYNPELNKDYQKALDHHEKIAQLQEKRDQLTEAWIEAQLDLEEGE